VSVSRQIESSRSAGRSLAQAFSRGAAPQPIPTQLRLQSGEFCVAEGYAQISQFVGADVEYVTKRGGYMGGGVVGLVALRGAQAARNRGRRRSAERAAQPQWRLVDEGQTWLTNYRFAVRASQWIDLWHGNINTLHCDGTAIHLEISGLPPTRLHIGAPDWWFVMLHRVAFDAIVWPPEWS
jgi:hypothetical protein